MKIASLAFLTVLFLAHCAGDPAELCGLPLSMFRDGDWAAFGYALFGLLLAVAGLMIVTLLRGGLYGQVGLFILAALLLLEVAVTSSYDAFHLLCSLVLLGLLYAYYAVVLHGAGSAWFWVHLAAPGLLMGVTRCHSYGLWQKSFIVYFVLAANVHHHMLSRGLRAQRRAPARPHLPDPWLLRRPRVYDLEPSRSWARRR